MRHAATLFYICPILFGATLPDPDLAQAKKVSVWATEYHIYRVSANSGNIPLLDINGKELGPRLSAADFCQAALEGSLEFGVRPKSNIYGAQGMSKEPPQADCAKIVREDVGRARFDFAKGRYGDGIQGFELVPYRTVAAKSFPAGTVLFIPEAKGTVLPDGSVHDGYFFVADTGNLKPGQIDVFLGHKEISFKFIRSRPKPPVTAYIIEDQAVKQILADVHHGQSGNNPLTVANYRKQMLAGAAEIENFTAALEMTAAAPEAAQLVAKQQTAPAAATASSATIPDHGKPRGDYVPCLFTEWDRLRFKNAVYVKGIAAALERQRLSGRITAPPDKLDALVKTIQNPDDAGGIVRTLLDGGYIKAVGTDKDAAAAANVVYSAIVAGGTTEDAFDVSCSQSVMTYKETSDIFGKRVANTYVAIQVVVRNLNPDKEFLMHDVQVAVDYGPDGKPRDDRFAAGRDKLLVRGVSVRGQSDDPRNRWIRIAEAVGNIASASTIGLKAIDFRNGVSVYQSAFIPGLKSVFPDYTIDQVNRLNDMAFSSNTSYKLVVPKNGSAPLVTFIPEDIFAQDYKSWKSDQLHEFTQRVWVVFAGVHISEENAGQITATDLACPADTSGFVDLTGSGKTVDCTLKGDNLQTVAKVRLRSAHDSTDPAQVDADLGSSGSVKFNMDDLRKLTGAEYSVILVDKSGREISTKLTLKFTPTVTSVGDVDVSKCKGICTVDVSGAGLSSIQAITLTKGSTAIEGTVGSGDATKRSVQFRASDFKENGDYDVGWKRTSGDKVVSTGKKVKVSGAAK